MQSVECYVIIESWKCVQCELSAESGQNEE